MEQEIKALIVTAYDENSKLDAVEMWANGINATVAQDFEKAKYFFRHEAFDAVIISAKFVEDELLDFLQYVDQVSRDNGPFKKTVFIKNYDQLNLCSELHHMDLIAGFFNEGTSIGKICQGIKSGLLSRKNQGKRSFPRFGVRLPGVIKVLGEDGIIEGEVRDLSAGGLSIHVDRKFSNKLHDLAQIRFGITLGGEGRQVVGDGSLSWVKDKDEPQSASKVRIGIKFTSVNPEAKVELAKYLNIVK